MKRSAALALVLGLAAVVAAWAPIAGGRPSNVRVTCKTRALDVYFWPHGHPYVKAYRFPASKAPNLTVYRRGSVASRAFFVFVSARGFNYANTCELATNPLSTSWGGGPRKSITATRRVRCTFPAVVQIKVIPPGGFRVLRGASPNELMRGRIAAKGSSLTFDRRYCKATPVPGVK
ncbi:MAG TPA: hypothetical protein VLK24_00830 [Gaiellaceae bacterium]|nr:hypothetical protein [Gaiellaceae bacterium]